MADLCPDCQRPKRRAMIYGGCSGFCLADAIPEWRGNCRVVTIDRLKSELASALQRAEAAERTLVAADKLRDAAKLGTAWSSIIKGYDDARAQVGLLDAASTVKPTT